MFILVRSRWMGNGFWMQLLSLLRGPANSAGELTVAGVTQPFAFEGQRRMLQRTTLGLIGGV